VGGHERIKGKVYDEGLHNVYRSQNIVKIMTSKKMGWVEHVASTRYDY
jgi:hypothetical protein